MKYSDEERRDMIFVLGECMQNTLLASRIYIQKYPERRHPDRNVFERIKQIFHNNGDIKYKILQKRKCITENEENEYSVIGSLIENPHSSQRKISRDCGISRSSVQRILKKYKYYPYRIQLHQLVTNNDANRRLEFCSWVLQKYSEDCNFPDFIMFTDECSFHNTGLVNRQNFRYYDTENPHFSRSIDHQHRWCVNTWGGIMGNHVFGPHFFEGPLDGNKFLLFLRNEFSEMLDDIPLGTRRKMWLQLDGAPAHFRNDVRQYLDREFPNRWIGRAGPQNWPARSPDLTSPDFFLWGYIKSLVYEIPVTTPQDMKRRIKDAFENITPSVLCNVKHSFLKRIRLCIEKDGGTFEQFL